MGLVLRSLGGCGVSGWGSHEDDGSGGGWEKKGGL